jgi:thiamine-monophosphate kinase
MKLSELGERKIIELFTRSLSPAEEMRVGIGDDACVYEWGGREGGLVISTDLITCRSHIPREMTPRQIGRMAVNVNLSDLAAMGADPFGLVFALGLPGSLEEDFVVELSLGMDEAAREHGAWILGGDTKEHVEVVISGTALGRVGKRCLSRGGARVGDFLCVTGVIGSAAAGFYTLLRDLPERPYTRRFLRAALEPQARVREGLALVEKAHACTDISDGLAWSLHEIAHRSGKGFLVYEEAVPTDPDLETVAELAGVPPREILFHKGGDYELLFSLDPSRLDEVREAFAPLGTPISVIGEVTVRGERIRGKGEREEEPLEPRGYESFLSRF